MRLRYKALRRRSLITAALGLALCLAIPAGAKAPSWDKKIEGKGRFKVLKAFDDEAVLDKETGLVWQRTVTTSSKWTTAVSACQNKSIGDRGGWRLPRFEELATLINPATGDLPSVHPFDAPVGDFYWTATNHNDLLTPHLVWVLATGGALDPGLSSKTAPGNYALWCVRGGAGLDYQ